MALAVDDQWATCGDCNCVDGISPFPRWEITGLIPASTQCPRKAKTAESGQWLELYSHYKDGHLLKSGGIEDQPAIYLEAMRTIQHAIGAMNSG